MLYTFLKNGESKDYCQAPSSVPGPDQGPSQDQFSFQSQNCQAHGPGQTLSGSTVKFNLTSA